jgi:hypothetical protein
VAASCNTRLLDIQWFGQAWAAWMNATSNDESGPAITTIEVPVGATVIP